MSSPGEIPVKHSHEVLSAAAGAAALLALGYVFLLLIFCL